MEHYEDIIVRAFANDVELSRLLSLIDNVAIIEYDGSDVSGSAAFAAYLDSYTLDRGIVKRIVLCGCKGGKVRKNAERLGELYPSAKIHVAAREWNRLDNELLEIRNTLVLHNAASLRFTDTFFKMSSTDDAIRFRDFVEDTRSAYYICLLEKDTNSLFDSPVTLETKLRLSDFAFYATSSQALPTSFCAERQDFIQTCLDTLTEKDSFFQALEEVEHGCEECNQCVRYGKGKKCPYAQRIVAQFYRKGKFVPRCLKTAHQWEMMSSRQGYRDAEIQVANDFKDGAGCAVDLKKAYNIFSRYAKTELDGHCINRALDIVYDGGVDGVAAVPYFAYLAKSGDEDMIIRLSDAFQNGSWGLPKDMVQQREWIEQGAENGNPRFVKAMAEMYEANGKWEDSYKWYRRLREVAPDMVGDDKLEEIELKILTSGATAEEITEKGVNYLFGFHGMERDTHLAYRYLKYAKELGNAYAEGMLGRMYYKGIEIDEDYDIAIELLTDAADKGDLMSMDLLTDIYYDTYDGSIDINKWKSVLPCRIEELARENNPIALYLKGIYLESGFTMPEDYDEAFKCMEQAALAGLPPAQYRLSMMYDEGTGVFPDSGTSERWLKKAAVGGYYKAKGDYGVQQFHLWLTRMEAFPYLIEAHEQGYDEGEVYWCLAQCYMDGYGTPVDKAKAYPMYIKEAEQGNVSAQVKLCQDYFNGNSFLPKDFRESARWGEEALMSGNKSVKFNVAYASASIGKKERAYELYLELAENGNSAAMNNLGCLEKDEKKAAEWFLKAADKGDEVAQKNIARYYRYGIAVEKDTGKAAEYYRKSANQGYIEAIVELAKMYRDGNCVEKDEAEALRWFEKAVEKGHTQSMIELASQYRKGSMVRKDIDKAIHYYKLAAEKGDEQALLCLGDLYDEGVDVEWNEHKAVYWYRKAAAAGSKTAKEKLKRMGVNWMENGRIENDLGEGDEINDDLPF